MGLFTSDYRDRLGLRDQLAFTDRRGLGDPYCSARKPTPHDPVDHIACLDELWLGQAVEDRRANPARVDKAGRTKHGQVLARVRKVAAKFLGEVADRVLTLSQHVQQHQSLGVGQHPAYFRVQPIPLRISMAHVFHRCPLPAPGVRPDLGYHSTSCVLAQVEDTVSYTHLTLPTKR